MERRSKAEKRDLADEEPIPQALGAGPAGDADDEPDAGAPECQLAKNARSDIARLPEVSSAGAANRAEDTGHVRDVTTAGRLGDL